MVKSYQRFVREGAFGVVVSSPAGAVWGGSGIALSGALDDVRVWNVRQGRCVASLHPEGVGDASGVGGGRGGPGGGAAQVTVLRTSPGAAGAGPSTSAVATGDNILAAGYTDGAVRLWSAVSGECTVVFSGHRSAVTAMTWSSDGTLLATGANDTDVIVWDVVEEAGRVRLRGHTNTITGVAFLEESGLIVTSSKDTFVKVWDWEAQHCLHTIVGHRNEVWALAVDPWEQRLITGSIDADLRAWNIEKLKRFALGGAGATADAEAEEASGSDGGAADGDGDNDGDDDAGRLKSFTAGDLPYLESLSRMGKGRVSGLHWSADGHIVVSHGHERMIDIFRRRTPKEQKKRRKRRTKRLREKLAAEAAEASGDDGADFDPSAVSAPHIIADEYVHYLSIRTRDKVVSVSLGGRVRAAGAAAAGDVGPDESPMAKSYRLLVALTSNVIEEYVLKTEDGIAERAAVIQAGGHRSDVRSVALSSEDDMLVTTSSESVKVWNTATKACIRTMESGYGLCSIFVPGDRHVLIGTKTGTLELFDVRSATCTDVVQAHDGAVWSISLHPAQRSFCTGSADAQVKFWDFEVLDGKLSFVHTRTLRMSEDVVATAFSADGRLVAVALLDATIKVFFQDSMRFFLSLYGHKLPVLCMDISDDNTLIATGSADKNVKLWGLDFGDCHKSIFAHDDSVMQVKFIPQTHYFVTSSKDGTIKFWDGDTFDHVLTLEGHFAPVWGLAVATDGDFVVTASQDRSIRTWLRTEEQLFLEEERELRLDSMFELPVLQQDPDDGQKSTAIGGQKTMESVQTSERLIEALELAAKARVDDEVHAEAVAAAKAHAEALGEEPEIRPPPSRDPLLRGMAPGEYVLSVLRSAKTNELEEVLMILPFATVIELLLNMEDWVVAGRDIELVSRCLFFVLSVYQTQIMNTGSLLGTLHTLRSHARTQLQAQKDVVGYNMAALTLARRELESNKSVNFFGESGAGTSADIKADVKTMVQR